MFFTEIHFKKIILVLSIVFFSFINVFSQPVYKELENYLTSYYKNKNIPSISAGAVQNGKITWLSSKGFADVENLVPATSKTIYRIASISKPITAVAVMQLVEEGKINLDADARTYIPYFPAKKWKFTTRHLLNHTSGIRDYKTGEFESKDYYKSIREVVEMLGKDSLAYQPGSRYVYSTLAYNLIAAIIENVSGMTFADYLNQKIFIPAGMNYTTIEYQKEIVLNRARGYVKSAERKLKNAPLADLSIKHPGGGIISSSEDLLKFADYLMNGGLIKTSTLDSMLNPTRLTNGEYRNYGLGFDFGTDKKGRRFFAHSGGGTGFSSLLICYPTEKLAAVHLTNIRDRNLGSPASDIAAIILKDDFDIPKISLADNLMETFLESNIDSSITVYKKVKSDMNPDFDISEDELTLFGNDLISIQRFTDAIRFFKFIISEFPENTKTYTGLADAYYKDGNTGMALNNYRKALKLDPKNKYAANMVNKLN